MTNILELYRTSLSNLMRVQKHFVENGQRYFDGWITGPYTEQKYYEFSMLHSLPYVGDYMDYVLDKRQTEEYFDRYGMDYTNIHDPRKVPSFGSTTRLYGNAYNFVSKNLNRLYR